jgi:hypothetical protein
MKNIYSKSPEFLLEICRLKISEMISKSSENEILNDDLRNELCVNFFEELKFEPLNFNVEEAIFDLSKGKVDVQFLREDGIDQDSYEELFGIIECKLDFQGGTEKLFFTRPSLDFDVNPRISGFINNKKRQIIINLETSIHSIDLLHTNDRNKYFQQREFLKTYMNQGKDEINNIIEIFNNNIRNIINDLMDFKKTQIIDLLEQKKMLNT